MIYGITPSGFVRKRLPEIRAEIIESMTSKLSALAGKAVTVETAPNSVTGALIDTFADREAAVWERMEATYYAMYPNTSEGVNQDNAVAFTGVTRQGDTNSRVYGLIEAVPGTTVQAGTVARVAQTEFLLDAPVVVSQNNAGAFRVEVATITPLTNYTITVNGAAHTYAAPGNVTSSSILASVLSYLQSLGLVTEQVSGGINAYVDGRNSVSVGVSPNLALTSIESPGLFIARDPGPVDVAVGALNQIAGTATVTGVRNILPGVAGTLRENSSELAARYVEGPFRLGSGTLPAIRANLRQNVPGIIDLKVVQNLTETTDAEGRPSGAIEVIVRGGDEQELRRELLRVKGAGTPAYGLSNAAVQDEEGNTHIIGLTRPTALYVWLSIRIVLKEGAVVGASTFQQIQAMAVINGNQYKSGEDVIRQEFIGPIYELTDAVSEIELKTFATSDVNYSPSLSEYAETNIEVGDRQFASFALNRVAVF